MESLVNNNRYAFLMSLSLLLILSSCKKDDTPPVAGFTIDPPDGNVQTAFVFDASTSTDKEDPTAVLMVRWDWESDGQWDTDWSSNKKINHNYTDEGTYYVSMEVKDTDGHADSKSIGVTVLNTPIAAFIATITNGQPPLFVEFIDHSTHDPTSWHWDFGDGQTSEQQNPTHIYTMIGNYSVTLLASNEYGIDSIVKYDFISIDSVYTNGISCPETPYVKWKGHAYNTILIQTQCWLKENLVWDTGVNWCYNDDPINCLVYGRLYDFSTMMNGATFSNTVPSGIQGICPDGWHVPSDKEWKIFEGSVDSQYGIGSEIWNGTHWRGYDAGKLLKSTSGWYHEGNGEDLYGFKALPAGYKHPEEGYTKLGEETLFWSTATFSFRRRLMNSDDKIFRGGSGGIGYSLRCLMD